MPTWYYIDKCPCKEDCSAQSWKKAKVWGYTKNECKKQLEHHLTISTLHKSLQKKGRAAVDKVIDSAPIVEWYEDEDEEKKSGSDKDSDKSRSRSRSARARMGGVWTEPDAADAPARVLVDRAELETLVEDMRTVLHNAERLLRHSS